MSGTAFESGSNATNMVFVGNMVRGGHDAGVSFMFQSDFRNDANTEFYAKAVDMDVPAGVDVVAASTFTDLYVADDPTILKIGTRADFDDPPALTFTPTSELVFNNAVIGGSRGIVLEGNIADESGSRSRSLVNGDNNKITSGQLGLTAEALGYYTYDGSNWLLLPDLISRQFADDVTDIIETKYLTVVIRLDTFDGLGSPTNNGPLPQRYVDAILIGRGTPPATPDPNAGPWVVYEDILA